MTTAAEFVKSAFYLSNVKDSGETISGYDASTGLDILNNIISQWSGLSIYIPTYTIYPFSTVIGDYTYDITPPVTQFLEGSVTDINNVKTDLIEINLKRKNLLNYAAGVQSQGRPTTIFVQNSALEIMTKSTFFLFPVPDQIYSIEVSVKQHLTEKTYSQQVLDIPGTSNKALKMQLASDISLEYGSILPPKFEKEYDRVMKELKASNKRDLTVKTRNIFHDRFRRMRPWYRGGWYG